MSLEAEFNKVLDRLAAQNQGQNNPFSIPSGFFKAYDTKGKRRGYGFYCPKCKLHIPGNAKNEIKHCNKVSQIPTGLFSWLKTMGFEHYKIKRGYY